MNLGNAKRGLWQQIQNGNKASYAKVGFTQAQFEEATAGMFIKKKKKPTRRKQTIKKVNGKAANEKFFVR